VADPKSTFIARRALVRRRARAADETESEQSSSHFIVKIDRNF